MFAHVCSVFVHVFVCSVFVHVSVVFVHVFVCCMFVHVSVHVSVCGVVFLFIPH